jgi:hypothetical protein
MAGTIAIQGSIAANGVVIAGSELSGRIHAGCDLSGSIFVGSGGSGVIGIGNGTAGSITESGLVYTGDTLGGLTVSGHNWGWVGGTFGDYVLGSTASPPSTYGLSVGTALAFRESDGDLVRISYEGATGDPMTILLHDGTRSIEGITCSGISEGDDISVQVTRGPAGDGYTTVDGITLSDACLGQITVQGTLGSFLASSLGTGGVITACGFSSISLTGGDLAGTITDTGDLGDISVAGDISGKIAVEGQLFGTLQTHQDLSGTISIKGGGTGGIIIGDGITGDITTAGAVYCGSTLSGITISGQNLGTVLGTLGTYVVGGSSSSNYVAYDLDVFTVTDDSDPTNQAVDGSDNDSALSTPLYVMEGTDGTATINLGLSWTTDPGNVNASAYTWRVVKTDGTIVCSGDFDDSTTVSFDGPPSGSTDPADGLVIVQVFGANGQDRRDIPVCVYTPGSLCCMTDYFTNWLATRSTSCADSPRDVLIDRLREKLEQLGEEYDRLSAEVDAALAELQQQDDLMKRTQEKIAYWKGEADFMHTTFMHLVEVFWVAPSYAYLAGYIASALGASATGVGAVSIVVGGGVAFSMAEYPEFRLLNNMYAQITQEADRAGARNNYVDLWDSQTVMLEEIQRTEAALSAVQHQGSSR